MLIHFAGSSPAPGGRVFQNEERTCRGRFRVMRGIFERDPRRREGAGNNFSKKHYADPRNLRRSAKGAKGDCALSSSLFLPTLFHFLLAKGILPPASPFPEERILR